MIRTAIISVAASFVLFGAWAVNLVSYHSAPDLNALPPLSAPAEVGSCASLHALTSDFNVRVT